MLAQAENLRAVTRAEVVAAARSWLGTPYRHQASVKGAGCDCLGLVRGVWRELYGFEPEAAPAYRADWAETGGRETLLAAARRRLVAQPRAELRLGDVLLFRMSPEACVKHAAIVSEVPCPLRPDAAGQVSSPAGGGGLGEAKIVHAYWGRAAVESWLGPWWRRRLVARFEFPGVYG